MFSNLNYNCFNVLYLRNFKEEVKWYFLTKNKEYPEYVGHFLLEFFIIKKFQKKMTNVCSVLLAINWLIKVFF